MRFLLSNTVAAIIAFSCPASADDTRLAATLDDFGPSIESSLAEVDTSMKLEKVNCLTGPVHEKRTICNYVAAQGFGHFAAVMASTRIDNHDHLMEINVVCSPRENMDAIRCLLLDTIALKISAPQISKDKRSSILKDLLKGLDSSESTRIAYDDVSVTLQKSAGLWFTVTARKDDFPH